MTTMVSWQMVNPKQPLERVEVPLPEPKDGEVLLKVSGCGVCHTDLGFFYDGVPIKSALPLTLGHEISGIVEATGPGAESWSGCAVVVPAVMPCGECESCKEGRGNICSFQKMPGNGLPFTVRVSREDQVVRRFERLLEHAQLFLGFSRNDVFGAKIVFDIDRAVFAGEVANVPV